MSKRFRKLLQKKKIDPKEELKKPKHIRNYTLLNKISFNVHTILDTDFRSFDNFLKSKNFWKLLNALTPDEKKSKLKDYKIIGQIMKDTQQTVWDNFASEDKKSLLGKYPHLESL